MQIIDKNTTKELSEKAKKTTRQRLNLNFHSGESDLLQRLLNAMEPSTYVRPHKHDEPDKREVFIILEGTIGIVVFDDQGKIIQQTTLNRDKGLYIAEIPPKTWHMLVSLETNSVMYEVKDGPYDEKTDKQFAPWAPEENSEKAETYLSFIKSCF